MLVLEIDAGGTQFAAGNASKDAFATLIDGDQWMVVRNVITGVLHWDFVSTNFPLHTFVFDLTPPIECPRTIHIFSRRR